MWRLVLRNLTHDAQRSALTVLAVAAVVAVILVLEGFYGGLLRQLRDVVLNRGADLIVTQVGVANMTATRSVLPQFARAEVEAVDGVAQAHPMTGLPIIFAVGERRTPVFLMVYDSLGGPSRLLAGTPARQPRDIVIDVSLARKFNLAPGDPFLASDFEFRVSGVAQGAAAFFTPFAFARFDDLIDFYFESDLATDISTFPMLSFLLIELASGSDPETVRRAIEAQVPVVDVFLPDQLADNDEHLGELLFGPIVRLLITVGYLIGILVTGIILFAAVNARRREYGVLKALGFRHGALTTAVVIEALLMALVAIPVGIVLAIGLGWSIEALMPLYLIPTTDPVVLARTALASLAFSLLGALIPLRLIRRLDPSLVFRS